jgi:hypothetical protein
MKKATFYMMEVHKTYITIHLEIHSKRDGLEGSFELRKELNQHNLFRSGNEK